MDPARPITVEVDKNILRVMDRCMSLNIDKNGCGMVFRRDGMVLNWCDGKDLAYIRGYWIGLAYDVREHKEAWMGQNLGLSVGVLTYGLGECFTPLVNNGQSVSVWNEDGGMGCLSTIRSRWSLRWARNRCPSWDFPWRERAWTIF